MPAFLVTGNPGSGKSALARELTRRGLLAIDPDHDRRGATVIGATAPPAVVADELLALLAAT
jgi:predicted ATPase